MKKENNKKNTKSFGFIFVEILIAITLIGIVFITLISIFFIIFSISKSIKDKTQVDFLIKEQLEAVRNFRDETEWNNDGLGSLEYGNFNPYYFSLDNLVNPPKWKINSGIQTVDVFTIKVIFDNVSRDLITKYIEDVYNQSHDDPNTKKVTVNVIWSGKTYQVVTYLTNWQNK